MKSKRSHFKSIDAKQVKKVMGATGGGNGTQPSRTYSLGSGSVCIPPQ